MYKYKKMWIPSNTKSQMITDLKDQAKLTHLPKPLRKWIRMSTIQSFSFMNQKQTTQDCNKNIAAKKKQNHKSKSHFHNTDFKFNLLYNHKFNRPITN